MYKALASATVAVLLILSPLTHADTQMNGIAIHSELGRESFIGALYATNLTKDGRTLLTAQEEKEIQVRVLADRLSSRRFKRMWIEGMAINANASELERQSQNMAKFSNMLKVTLARGDIFSMKRSLDDVTVSINGSQLGHINDPAFFDLLLRVWIGQVPLSSSFRNDLLAGGQIPQQQLALFDSLKPSDKRSTAIAAALNQSKTSTSASAGTAAAAATAAASVAKAPVIAAPKVTENKAPSNTTKAPEKKVAAATPKPKKAEKKPEKKASKPAKIAAAPDISDILEEDDEEFTAESLLSQQLYIAKLKKWTYKQLRYPQASVEKNEQGVVRLSVTIRRDGKVKNIDIIEEPDFPRLTKEAVRSVGASAPYPVMPKNISGDSFSFTLPVVFKLID
ncbi:TonB family protein [Agaribacterium haliotis]|uniref:TonB family protein n=1 Tax=Agaribacterium haliotis TaxID=2013869 RepID=UPI000BB59E71|nr:TonB family protein [Agaribacterium haliotis]